MSDAKVLLDGGSKLGCWIHPIELQRDVPLAAARPMAWLSAMGKRAPGVWRILDELRADPARPTIPRYWPEECYFPSTFLTGLSSEQASRCVLSVLCAWRTTQGIYRFDPILQDELLRTPITGHLPTELFSRLPDWCCYVAMDPVRAFAEGAARIYGFFVQMDRAPSSPEMPLLSIVFDVENLHDGLNALAPTPIRLIPGADLEDCIGATYEFDGDSARTALTSDFIQPAASLALYLCSDNAEILGRDGNLKPIGRPPLTCCKKREPRIMPPPTARGWDVGYRIGATLRAAGPAIHGPNRGGTHVRPRTHLRRAHWHAFWTGSKAKAAGVQLTDRKLVLHWLHPILVAAKDGEPVPTIHPVTAPEDAA